jgi:error-prone DNA polymerase
MAGDILTTCALRLGMREIKGLKEDAARRVAQMRGAGYDSVRDVWLRTALDVASLELLADADAFGSIGLSRRDALWAVRALGRTGDDDDLPLFSAPGNGPRREPDAHLPPMPLGEEVINDYRFLRMSLKAHPISFVRQRLDWRRVTPSARLGEIADGTRVAVAGLVLVRQRPGTAKGVIFATLEDEGGIANVIVWPKVFERFRPVVLGARALLVTGTLQSQNGVIHIVARHIEDATPMLGALLGDLSGVDPVMPADEVKRPEPGSRRSKAEGDEMRRDRIAVQLPLISELDVPARATRHALPKGRNFR